MNTRAGYGHDALTRPQLTKAMRAMDQLAAAASLA